MIWMYRRDLFEKHRDRMEQDLGFEVMPSMDSTWQQYLEMATWFGKNAREDVPYGTLHMAKQHDALMNDFSNVLWSFGGDYFKDGEKVGRMGSRDPGESLLTTDKSLEAAEFYQRLLKVAHPSSLGWDWTGAGEGFKAGQAAMAPLWHEDAAGVEDSALKGKVGFAPLPKGPARRSDMYGGTGLGINATASEDGQKAAWLFVVWATAKQTQLQNLKSEVGGGTPTLQSVYEIPEVVEARERPRRSRTSSRTTRSRRPGRARTSACARRSRRGTSATRGCSPRCRRCSPRAATRRSTCSRPRTAWSRPSRTQRRWHEHTGRIPAAGPHEPRPRRAARPARRAASRGRRSTAGCSRRRSRCSRSCRSSRSST
jgi:hypothetical protein